MSGRQYGLLLPHFGELGTPKLVTAGAMLAERLGFDSVWVRDHLVYHPHGLEGQDRTFLEATTTLAVVAAVTTKLILGTGSLIPFRHPVHLAQLLASLSRFAGPGRIIAGLGIGTFQHEFDVIGLGTARRADLLEEQVRIMQELWKGDPVAFHGTYYTFDDVDIHPSPASDIPIWYCGGSPAAVRRAVEYCQGWLPGRSPLPTYVKRIQRMRRLASEAGKPEPVVGSIPITSPARTREVALAKVNVEGMLRAADRNKEMVRPASGSFATAEDLDGALLAGPPDEIAAGVRRLEEAGCSHLVFDLRYRFEDWDECVHMLGEEVLPLLRGAFSSPVRRR